MIVDKEKMWFALMLWEKFEWIKRHVKSQIYYIWENLWLQIRACSTMNDFSG